MRKAFTLIELLAVIIILAIIALIAVPITLNIIEDAEKSANMTQVELLLRGAKQIYAQSFLNDEYKELLTDTNIYGNEIFKFTGNLPKNGVLKIKLNGEIFLAVEIDNICYTKDYTQDTIIVTELNEGDDCLPITVVISPTNPNLTNLYSSDIEIEMLTNGTSLRYCTSHSVDMSHSINNCTPIIDADQIQILNITEEGKTRICAVPLNSGVETSEVVCYEYKLDKTYPTLTLKSEDIQKISEGENIDVKTFFNVPSYGLSGEKSYTCNINNTENLSIGKHSIVCSAVSNSGLETVTTKEIEIITPGVNIADKITSLSGTEQGDGLIVEEQGYRYQGANPNNYIMYNDEVWRIIGLLDTTLADGVTVEPLLKIIRVDSIGKYSRKQSSADWATSDLNNILNDNYLNSTVASDSFANCSYSGNGGCDFTTLGIKPEYRDMIQEVTWNLGAVPTAKSTALEFYNYERESSSAETAFTAKLGIMYPSDYGFAVTESDCARTEVLYNYDSTTCKNNNWLYTGILSLGMITNQDLSYVYELKSSGYIGTFSTSSSYNIRPVLYLKSDVIISDALGSYEDPYEVIG